MTRLIELEHKIFVKLEMENPAGSHKYRAAKNIIEKAINSGKIIRKETTIIEKTGGNFGFGLVTVCKEYDVQLELAIGLSFSQRKRDLLEFLGARLIGKDMLENGFSPKEVIQYHITNQETLDKKYFYTDQFQNYNGVAAHKEGTGLEMVRQLQQRGIFKQLIFVGGAGTGASLNGVSLALKDAGMNLKTILVEPAGCDMKNNIFTEHRMEGVSVGVAAPFIDWRLVYDVVNISLIETLIAQKWFYEKTGLFIGNSSAANIAAILKIRLYKEFKNTPIVTLAYDSGLWYDDWREGVSEINQESKVKNSYA